jgi:FkbM family methyltransferase
MTHVPSSLGPLAPQEQSIGPRWRGRDAHRFKPRVPSPFVSSKFSSSRAKRQIRRAAKILPAGVRRRGVAYIARTSGVRDREILGRPLRIEGSNHGAAEYDDAWLIGLIAEADGFVDIGCNVGFFSLASCILRPTSRVLAIDANPECAAVTAANLVRNGFGDRSQTVSAFVADKRGDVQFHSVGLGAAGSGIEGLSPTAEEFASAIVVQSDTLDAILERTDFTPDLVKIDVEGAEREVLAGATRTVVANEPKLLVEMHSGGSLTMERNAEDVLAWCDEHGYGAWYLAKGRRLEGSAEVAHRGRCHLLLQARDVAFPSVLEGIAQSAPVSSVLERIGWSVDTE